MASTPGFDPGDLGSNPGRVVMKCKCKRCKEVFDSWKSYRHCKVCRRLLPGS